MIPRIDVILEQRSLCMTLWSSTSTFQVDQMLFLPLEFDKESGSMNLIAAIWFPRTC